MFLFYVHALNVDVTSTTLRPVIVSIAFLLSPVCSRIPPVSCTRIQQLYINLLQLPCPDFNLYSFGKVLPSSISAIPPAIPPLMPATPGTSIAAMPAIIATTSSEISTYLCR